jgi:hypothetical protein
VATWLPGVVPNVGWNSGASAYAPTLAPVMAWGGWEGPIFTPCVGWNT